MISGFRCGLNEICRSSGVLTQSQPVVTDVSGQPIGSIRENQVVARMVPIGCPETSLTLKILN